MLDGINSLLDVVGAFWTAFFSEMPIYGNVTLGWFIIGIFVISFVFNAFILRFKL